jgi:hypothetical protein
VKVTRKFDNCIDSVTVFQPVNFLPNFILGDDESKCMSEVANIFVVEPDLLAIDTTKHIIN